MYERALKEDFDTGDFVVSLKYLYENLPESDALLKATAIKTACGRSGELSHDDNFMTLCKEIGEIGCDIIEAISIAKTEVTTLEPKSQLPLSTVCVCGQKSCFYEFGNDDETGNCLVRCKHCKHCNVQRWYPDVS